MLARSDEGSVAPERLTFHEGGRYASSRGCGSRQHLGWKDEEPVGIADRGGQDTQASEHGWRMIRTIIGVEHPGLGDRLCSTSTLRHLENEIAFGGDRHCNREPARRRNEQPRAVVCRRIMDVSIGVSILANDGDRRMSTGRSFRELDVHVGKVAHIREHPDLGLASLASDDRLKLAIHRELHISLVIRQRWIRWHIALGLAARRDEVLKIAGNELEAAATIVDRKRSLIPDGKVLRSRLRSVEVNRRERWLIGSVREFAGLGRDYSADPLRPGHIVELCQTAGTVEENCIEAPCSGWECFSP